MLNKIKFHLESMNFSRGCRHSIGLLLAAKNQENQERIGNSRTECDIQ